MYLHFIDAVVNSNIHIQMVFYGNLYVYTEDILYVKLNKGFLICLNCKKINKREGQFKLDLESTSIYSVGLDLKGSRID